MKVTVLSVGKPGRGGEEVLFREYADRIGKLGVAFESKWVREIKPGGRYSDDHVREREARNLRDTLPKRGTVVALDRAGEAMDSVRLADRITAWTTPGATFVIGGPLGLHGSFLREATAVWSLSPLTFPHELARVLVAEQIYRAFTLIRGIPYHK